METSNKRAIRIGNASGAVGDGIDQIYRLAKESNVDAITADYLAEFNIAWKAIEMKENPDLGYEPIFLEQLAWNNGDAARLVHEHKIKIVHNGGALNPQGLATKTRDYLHQIGITTLKIAWVSGDNVTSIIRQSGAVYKHLDIEDLHLPGNDISILAANAYTGQSGIVAALENGADIIICGRCCDASPVMALSTWWHNWAPTDYNKHAGSLIAGHIIECGPYSTGGNYCGLQEIPEPYRLGYPIAEVFADGTSIITKPDHSNGIVTEDTVKAQYLYEIQGPLYLNPDVIAKIDGGCIEEIATDRVRISGVTGMKPPPTTKLAICLLGGYQAEIAAYAVGLDITEKLENFRTNILRELNMSEFTTVSIEPYGTQPQNPRTQAEGTVMFRLFVQAPEREAIAKFKRAIFFNGQAGYCGMHLSMDWRTLEPRPYVKYFPAVIQQVNLEVHFIGGDATIKVPQTHEDLCSIPALRQDNYETENPLHLSVYGDTTRAPLGDLVFARSGDKGGNANIGLWVRNAEAYPWLQAFMTVPRMIDLLGDDWSAKYSVHRFELVHLHAVHFVIYGILQEGVSSSSIIDGLAKSFAEFVRARHVDLPTKLLQQERELRRRKQAEAASKRESLER